MCYMLIYEPRGNTQRKIRFMDFKFYREYHNNLHRPFKSIYTLIIDGIFQPYTDFSYLQDIYAAKNVEFSKTE